MNAPLDKFKINKDSRTICLKMEKLHTTFNQGLGSSLTPKFLMPQTQSIQPQAGLKHVEKPHRRCCHCYMVFEDERTWVFCDKYPRLVHSKIFILPIQSQKILFLNLLVNLNPRYLIKSGY